MPGVKTSTATAILPVPGANHNGPDVSVCQAIVLFPPYIGGNIFARYNSDLSVV